MKKIFIFLFFAISITNNLLADETSKTPYVEVHLIKDYVQDGEVLLAFCLRVVNSSHLGKDIDMRFCNPTQDPNQIPPNEVMLSKDGWVLSKYGTILQEHILTVSGMLWGEVVEIFLDDFYAGERYQTTVAPFPRIAYGENQEEIEIITIDPSSQIFDLKMKNFKEDEPLQFISFSEGEKMEHSLLFQPNSEGLMSCLMAPAVIGKSGGNAYVSVQAKGASKPIKLSYKWGLEATKTVTIEEWNEKKEGLLSKLMPLRGDPTFEKLREKSTALLDLELN